MFAFTHFSGKIPKKTSRRKKKSLHQNPTTKTNKPLRNIVMFGIFLTYNAANYRVPQPSKNHALQCMKPLCLVQVSQGPLGWVRFSLVFCWGVISGGSNGKFPKRKQVHTQKFGKFFRDFPKKTGTSPGNLTAIPRKETIYSLPIFHVQGRAVKMFGDVDLH